MENRDKGEWVGFWRPAPRPAAAVPLGARSVGHVVAPAGWACPRGVATFYNLFWTLRGEGRLRFEEAEAPVRLAPGEAAIYAPGRFVRVDPSPAGWAYRFLTVDGAAAASILDGFGLAPPWPRRVGRCPETLFEQLEREIQTPGREAEIRCDGLVYAILSAAAEGAVGAGTATEGEEALARRCAERMERDFADPDMNVAALAAAESTHRSRISRACRKHLGAAPSAFLRRLRLGRGLQLLRHTDRPVAEIARETGFADPAYFSRCIRDATGQSPRSLRYSL